MYYLAYNQLHVNNDISMETTITNRIEVNCTECGKVINKKSLKAHLRLHEKRKPEESAIPAKRSKSVKASNYQIDIQHIFVQK